MQSTMHKLVRSSDNVDKLKEMLEAGADPNELDKLSRTPLHIAVWAGHVAMIEALLDNPKTDPNAVATDDFTPLVSLLKSFYII